MPTTIQTFRHTAATDETLTQGVQTLASVRVSNADASKAGSYALLWAGGNGANAHFIAGPGQDITYPVTFAMGSQSFKGSTQSLEAFNGGMGTANSFVVLSFVDSGATGPAISTYRAQMFSRTDGALVTATVTVTWDVGPAVPLAVCLYSETTQVAGRLQMLPAAAGPTQSVEAIQKQAASVAALPKFEPVLGNPNPAQNSFKPTLISDAATTLRGWILY